MVAQGLSNVYTLQYQAVYHLPSNIPGGILPTVITYKRYSGSGALSRIALARPNPHTLEPKALNPNFCKSINPCNSESQALNPNPFKSLNPYPNQAACACRRRANRGTNYTPRTSNPPRRVPGGCG